MSEQQRLSVQEVSPAAIEAVLGMERFVRSTEAVTRLPVAGVPDPVWEAAATQFSESEMVQLLMAVTTINVWNRLSVSTRQHPPFDASELQPAAAAV